MLTTCCAVNYANRHSKTSTVTFRFPEDSERCGLWVRAVSRDKWELKDHYRICSDHFVSGKPSKDRDNVDYVPTVFNDGKKRIVARSNPERADRAAKRRKHVDEVSEVASILVDLSTSSVEMGEVGTDHQDTVTTTACVASSTDAIATLNAEVILLKTRVLSLERLLLEKDQAPAVRATFGMQNIAHNDEAVRFYTGFPNYGVLVKW